ncbi:MAG: hypothetical protein ACT4QF_00125 [Sporichthyaceae bacterium]
MTDRPPALPEDEADATSQDGLVEFTDDSPDLADGDQDGVDQDPLSEDEAAEVVAASIDLDEAGPA